MKDSGALVVSLSQELTIYLKEHPEELPPGVNKDSLNAVCSSYLIDNIENYTFSPYKDKFLWRVKFRNSQYQEYEYMYFITYKAVFNGAAGIVEAKLIKENTYFTGRAHMSN
ncbi:MAG: hypothetical protein ACXVB0_23565 [Mucilaginibacter sp.]